MPDGYLPVKTPVQILKKLEEWEKQHITEKDSQNLKEPERLEVSKDVTDEFKSAPSPTKEDQIKYALGLQTVLQPQPEKKAEDVRHLLGTVVEKTTEAANAVTQAKNSKDYDAVHNAINKTAEAAKTSAYVYLPTGTYKREDWEKVQQAHQNLRNALGEGAKGVVDGVTAAANGIAAFGRGIWYGIVGPPEDEDLSDEIAALKGTGFALMTGGAAGAAIAAATGVGLPAAAICGGLSLLGWALTDNFAGRLEFIQSQREKEKKDKEKMAELEDFYKRKREEDIAAWEEAQNRYLEKKKATEIEILEIKKSYYNDRETRKEAEDEVWKEVKKEKEAPAEEKSAKEEEDRKFFAALQHLRALVDEIDGLQKAAGNAYYAKNIPLAIDLAQQALSKVDNLKAKINEYADVIKKYGYYEAFMDQVSSIENVLKAQIKAWNGQTPTREVRNAVTKYTNSTKHFNSTVRRYVAKKGTFDVYTPSDVSMMRSTLRIERKNAALGSMLSTFAENLLYEVPVIAEQESKLSPTTIVKFRKYLAEKVKTPLAKIANYIWNRNSGYAYDGKQLTLMYEALNEAGVYPTEVANLSLRELEAILRARQYLYAAAKRGFFLPYEFELYTRLKELLLLTDNDVQYLLRLKIPIEKEVVTSV